MADSNMVPECRSGSAGDRIGLGADTGGADEDDDEFDQYRKRMMLAYRFRPNPLVRNHNSSETTVTGPSHLHLVSKCHFQNNPRRSYY